jgi:ATP-dependent helicase HrpA
VQTLDIPDTFASWSFGELPDLIELERDGKSLVGFPVFRDGGESVSLDVMDDEAAARAVHKAGLRRLFMLQLKEQVRFVEKNLPNIATIAMQAMSYGLPYKSQPELVAQVLECTFDRAFMQTPWPVSAAQFEARLAEGKPRVTLIAQEIMRLLQAIVTELGAVQKKVGLLKPSAAASADVTQQIMGLFPKRFLCEVSAVQLAHYPRYLKGIGTRADKFKVDSARDARLLAELQPLLVRYQRERTNRQGTADQQLDELRWLLEELRVGLFAQELKTPTPVSVKRLEKVFDALNR